MRLQPVPALDDNYIWLLRDDAGRAVIVDPGDAVPVLAALDDAPPPHAILVTHHHPDHVGGIPDLLDQWPGLPVFAPADPRIPIATQRVREGDVLALGPWAFRVLELPGHTRSHVGYVADGVVFCGDTLFSLGCGRLFEGTPAQMLDSLDRLAALPGETRVCCTHEYTLANAAFALAVDPGNPDLQSRVVQARAQRATGAPTLPTTLLSERACNPFLRSRDPALRDALARHAGQPVADDVEAFALLRRWKDGFRG